MLYCHWETLSGLYFRISDRSRAAQNALRPQAAAAGGMGIADAVLFVLREQLAVSAVDAGCKFE